MPAHRKLLSLAGILVALVLSAPASAQVQDTDLAERTRVEYVLLDLLVFDRQGNPVTGLTLNDFEVLENRKRVTLDSLEILDLRAVKQDETAAAAPAGTPEGAAGARSLQVIVTDLRWVGKAKARKAFDQLQRFLESAPTGPDIGYALYDMEDGPLVEGYTSDPAVLLAELRRQRPGSEEDEGRGIRIDGEPGSGRGGGRVATPDGGAADLVALEARLDSCRLRHDMQSAMARGSGTGISGAGLFGCINAELRVVLDRLYARTEEAITNLEALAYRFGDGNAPVSILLVSPGFSLEAGRAAIELAQVYFDRAGRVDNPEAGEQPRIPERLTAFGSPRSYKKQFERVVHACLANRVSFHTFDMFNFNLGLDRKSDARLSHASPRMEGIHRTFKAEVQEGLLELSEKSGGFFHTGATLGPMGSVLERSRYVYTLGYASPGGKPGKFRKIKVKCKRNGVKLRHRQGYYGRPAATTAR